MLANSVVALIVILYSNKWNDLIYPVNKNSSCVSLAPKQRTPQPRLRLQLKPITWPGMGRRPLQSSKNDATVLTLLYEPLRGETGLAASAPWLKSARLAYAGSAYIGWAATWSKSIECPAGYRLQLAYARQSQMLSLINLSWSTQFWRKQQTQNNQTRKKVTIFTQIFRLLRLKMAWFK